MKIGIECYPCFIKQAVEASSIVTSDETMRYEILGEVLKQSLALIESDSSLLTPVHVGMAIHKIIREKSGNRDPYEKLKKEYNRKALSLYDDMKQMVKSSKMPLKTAVKLAIAGNIIDFGVAGLSKEIEIKHIMADAINRDFVIDHFDILTRLLNNIERILYLADNAGEIVFDRILIEEIPNYENRVKLVVKKSPIINDATLEDAKEVGLANTIPVIDNGLVAPGTILDEVSSEFMKELEKADLIISKGQGNYEGLSDTGYPIFFLLKAKCEVIARDLEVTVGDIVLKYNGEKY